MQPSCRICFESNGTLCSLCECKGTMEYVHEECLNEWMRTSKKDHCPYCFMVFERKAPQNDIWSNVVEIFILFGHLIERLTQ